MLVSFFSNAESTTFQELENAARKQITQLGADIPTKLAKELKDHKTLDLKIDIDAPTILIPENLVDPSTLMLVVDLGNLAIRSSDKSKQRITPEDAFYDKFTLSLTSIQLLMANNTATYPISVNMANSMQLVDKFDINVTLYYCTKMDILFTQFTRLKYGFIVALTIQNFRRFAYFTVLYLPGKEFKIVGYCEKRSIICCFFATVTSGPTKNTR